MKLAAFFAALALVSAAPASATPAEDVAKPIAGFITAFNKGDMPGALANFAAGDITIVDEVPPHLWTGPQAMANWAADYDKNAKATGVSDGSVKLGKVTRAVVNGDSAYAIADTLYTYKENGRPMAEGGQMTFVLKQSADGWKISSWTWSGPNPHPVAKKRAHRHKR